MKDVSALTIRRDIERLQISGNDITVTKGAHNTAYYKMKNRRFTFNEIRFIVDSISINKFLSNGQKQHLIKKFEGICSEAEVRQLISRISLNGRGAPSFDLLENLEIVHRIISEKRRINFEYGKSDVNGNINYYSKKREIIPKKVVYFDERFYLKCVDEATLNLRVYRVDRMRNITAGEKTKLKVEIPKPDGVVLDMFEPEYFEVVTFRVKRFLLDDMLENFGNYASARNDTENEDSVIVWAKIGISQSFYRWVMRYGSNIEIISPEAIRSKFCEEIKKVFEIYEE
ncbi:MAG: WYL domain-containing protein [Lachnospiraceae bacterium]|nr:WYL domain-containing protein [Lachnospiraceae bacterium]MCM1231676.1 WYL domain-containing protein [Ruminococcus flavefaciens]